MVGIGWYMVGDCFSHKSLDDLWLVRGETFTPKIGNIVGLRSVVRRYSIGPRSVLIWKTENYFTYRHYNDFVRTYTDCATT